MARLIRVGLLGLLAAIAAAGAARAGTEGPPRSSAPSAAGREAAQIVKPDGFKIGFHAAKTDEEITEYVPEGETVEDWSRMITVQTFWKLKHVDPHAFATVVGKGWTSACPETKLTEVSRRMEGRHPVAVWIYACPRNRDTGKPETAFVKMIGGDDALFSVQYAYRKRFAEDLSGPALTFLRTARVCHRSGGENACPAE